MQSCVMDGWTYRAQMVLFWIGTRLISWLKIGGYRPTNCQTSAFIFEPESLSSRRASVGVRASVVCCHRHYWQVCWQPQYKTAYYDSWWWRHRVLFGHVHHPIGRNLPLNSIQYCAVFLVSSDRAVHHGIGNSNTPRTETCFDTVLLLLHHSSKTGSQKANRERREIGRTFLNVMPNEKQVDHCCHKIIFPSYDWIPERNHTSRSFCHRESQPFLLFVNASLHGRFVKNEYDCFFILPSHPSFEDNTTYYIVVKLCERWPLSLSIASVIIYTHTYRKHTYGSTASKKTSTHESTRFFHNEGSNLIIMYGSKEKKLYQEQEESKAS